MARGTISTAISQHAFTPTLSTTDDLYRVTVPYQGRVRSVHELRELLAEEVRQRQLILDEREREIIENHFIGDGAAHGAANGAGGDVASLGWLVGRGALVDVRDGYRSSDPPTDPVAGHRS